VLVTSDSDFTMLATRLRESEKFVFGVGKKDTPKSFINACDDFILTELLSARSLENGDGTAKPNAQKTTDTKQPNNASSVLNSVETVSLNRKEIENLLDTAYEKYQDEDGWAQITTAYNFIKRIKPDFDIKLYGFKKWSDLMASYKDKYEIKKIKSSGNAKVLGFRKKDGI